jgi:acyl carrier protein
MTEEISSTLNTYIVTQILKQPRRNLRMDEPLLTSGLVDSFNLVDLGLFVEDKFGVRIEDTELNPDTFNTLEQLTVLIQSRLS